jgi:hypothetical protein
VVTNRSDLFCAVMVAVSADPELLLLFGSNVLEVTDGVLATVVPSATLVFSVASSGLSILGQFASSRPDFSPSALVIGNDRKKTTRGEEFFFAQLWRADAEIIR